MLQVVRGSLFRQYALRFGALMGAALLVIGLWDILASYQQSKQALLRLNQEKVHGVASDISHHLNHIRQAITFTTTNRPGVAALERRIAEVQLLTSTDYYNRVLLLDPEGREVMRASPRSESALGNARDFPGLANFSAVKSGRPYTSPAYWRDNGLFMSVAMAVGPQAAGITVAEIDLQILNDVIVSMTRGTTAQAYIVDEQGRLLAHSNPRAMRFQQRFSALPQVMSAIRSKVPGDQSPQDPDALSFDGVPVLTTSWVIPEFGWRVLLEEPTSEAYRPLVAQAWRSALLLLLSVVVTVWVCVIVVRRVVRPIRTLEHGATRLGQGAFDHRIVVHTGDEIETLASAFNQMAARLQELHATLEARVSERTHQLEVSNRKNKTLLSALSDMILTIRRDGKVMARESSNRALTAAANSNPDPAIDAGRFRESIEQALDQGTVQEMSFSQQTVAGERHFQARVAPYSVDTAVVVVRDETRRVLAQKELIVAKARAEKADDAKSRFLAAASHDMRQPMMALTAYVNLLADAVGRDQQALVTNIKLCVGSLGELLDDVLDASKLDAGVVTAVASDFSVNELLNELVSVHAAEASRKHIGLRLRASDAIVRTDPNLLRRILGNFIANAVKYTQRGRVLIATRRRSGRMWVEVWDTGIGFPEDKTELIFEEFSQLGDGARNSGSGLGLSIAAKSAALLGLEIRVRSRQGHGSMFAIELPLGTVTAVVATAIEPGRPLGVRVALVEDNDMVREALAAVLTGQGHTVCASHSGPGLMKKLGDLAPDILISDYRLAAGETGLDVVAELRRVFGRALPSILLTGDTSPDLMRKLANSNISVLFKPANVDSINAEIRRMTGASLDQTAAASTSVGGRSGERTVY